MCLTLASATRTSASYFTTLVMCLSTLRLADDVSYILTNFKEQRGAFAFDLASTFKTHVDNTITTTKRRANMLKSLLGARRLVHSTKSLMVLHK